MNRLSQYVTQFRWALHDFLHLKSFILWMSILIVPMSTTEKFVTVYFYLAGGLAHCKTFNLRGQNF